MLQFQEQLGQGCSPEESDTFEAQGQCHEVSKRLIWPDSSCMFDVFVLYSWRIRYSRPDAAVPWTSTEAYATAGGITFNNTVQIKTKYAMEQHGVHFTCFPGREIRSLWFKVPATCWTRNQRVFVFPQDYLDMVGLSAMFPRVEVFLIQGSPVDMLERPPMDGKTSSCLGCESSHQEEAHASARWRFCRQIMDTCGKWCKKRLVCDFKICTLSHPVL